MKSDKELIKTFKVFIDENNILHLDVFKAEEKAEDSIRMIELIREKIFKIFEDNPQKKYNIFADVSTEGKTSRYGFSSKIRKIGVQMMAHKQIKKGAFFAKNTFVKVVVNFMVTAARRNKSIRFFSDKEKAFKWLKED